MDGGLVGKVVQSANVVPMEAIWRYARTECLECLECEGRQLHTVHRAQFSYTEVGLLHTVHFTKVDLEGSCTHCAQVTVDC